MADVLNGYKKPILEKRYRLRVCGPLPGRPHQLGEFVMLATAFGNRYRWWIKAQDSAGRSAD